MFLRCRDSRAIKTVLYYMRVLSCHSRQCFLQDALFNFAFIYSYMLAYVDSEDVEHPVNVLLCQSSFHNFNFPCHFL